MRAIMFLVSVLAAVFVQSAFAAGATTMLTVTPTGPGKAVLAMKNANAVYLNKVPDDVKAHFSAEDATGNGTAHIVDVANNPALANQQLCWRGVGSDWGGAMACAPFAGGNADVTIDVGAARNTAFALVPIIANPSKSQLAWAAHPENTRVKLQCPGMNKTDTASVFTVDSAGTIAIASQTAVAAYEKSYADSCRR